MKQEICSSCNQALPFIVGSKEIVCNFCGKSTITKGSKTPNLVKSKYPNQDWIASRAKAARLRKGNLIAKVLIITFPFSCAFLIWFWFLKADDTPVKVMPNAIARDISYTGLAGQISLEGDAELLIKSHILYKNGSYSLSKSITRGCRVARSRYEKTLSLTAESKSIYSELKPICEQYY
mgnify:CR=1 FL=1